MNNQTLLTALISLGMFVLLLMLFFYLLPIITQIQNLNDPCGMCRKIEPRVENCFKSAETNFPVYNITLNPTP